MARHAPRFRGGRAALGMALAALAVGATSGCAIMGFVAAGVEERRKARPRTIEAMYRGLDGKTFGVIVAADRMLQVDYPNVVPHLTTEVTNRLRDHVTHSGHIPAEAMLGYLYEHPRWVAKPRGQLARELGVDRLVFIEMEEFRLNEPGNRYLWDGAASGRLSVYEVDGLSPDEAVFEHSVRVKFPDKSGFSPDDLTAQQVASVLTKRFIDRSSWLLYDHEETGDMDY